MTIQIDQLANIVSIDQEMNDIVVQQTHTTVEVQEQLVSVIEVAAVGPQGIQGIQGITGATGAQGAPGPNAIGGYGISTSSISSGDLLIFNGSAWTNSPQAVVADGGNF